VEWYNRIEALNGRIFPNKDKIKRITEEILGLFCTVMMFLHRSQVSFLGELCSKREILML
jgi:hypothetical protein